MVSSIFRTPTSTPVNGARTTLGPLLKRFAIRLHDVAPLDEE